MKTEKHYIGDLCYVLTDNKTWGEVCGLIFPPNWQEEYPKGKQGEFHLQDGRKFTLYPTAHGDGC